MPYSKRSVLAISYASMWLGREYLSLDKPAGFCSYLYIFSMYLKWQKGKKKKKEKENISLDVAKREKSKGNLPLIDVFHRTKKKILISNESQNSQQ